MRLAGFSYGRRDAGGTANAFSPVEDASDFVRALLSFYAQYPQLEANPVFVVGESYGGVRAQYFLDLVLRYTTEAAKGGADLPGLLQSHFDAVFPSLAGTPIDEKTIATQFERQILIQPLVLGDMQRQAEVPLMRKDPYVGVSSGCYPAGTRCDEYDAAKPPGWSDGVTASAVLALSTDATAQVLLGGPLASIPELQPAARRDAFRSFRADVLAPSVLSATAQGNAALTASLGALATGDTYVVPFDMTDWRQEDDPTLFVQNVAFVRTFITDARYDSAIFARAIPAALASAGAGGTVDESPRPGVVRPGWFDVVFTGDAGSGAPPSTEVRFPSYVSSGHLVVVTQAQDLRDDVAAWLLEP
jgi:hypothetical protein